jgi:anti-anti-sigma regulatory factor
MAQNFHIFTHQTTNSLHLKLVGEFDGSSASELINVLELNQGKYYQIFIDTSELQAIHSFGKKVLQSRMSEISNRDTILKFIGKNIVQSLN